MNYLLFICSDYDASAEKTAVMRREVPAWVDEMDGRGVRLLGRALKVPETGATVRVRDGETLATDGPFIESKEFVGGFDLLDCADLDEAIEIAAKHPMSWFHTIEIRPFAGSARLSGDTTAFAREDDSAGAPYMLMMWMPETPAAPRDEAWQQELQARGLAVLGGALQGAETATTVRVRDGETLLGDGPVVEAEEFIAGIEVVRCADRRQAIELAAAHPVARDHAIEVRPFYSG